jgi:hypothetical protein
MTADYRDRPPTNPDSDAAADQAKHAYAMGTQRLAALQHRLADLAGTGQIHPKLSLELQFDLENIWEWLYAGTVCAVRDERVPDDRWNDLDNTYSDGSAVAITIQVEDDDWRYNRFLLGDGAVNDFPVSAIAHIARPPADDHDPS